MKIHKIYQLSHFTNILCDTPWVDDGYYKVTQTSIFWKKVTCKKCLAMRKKK